MKSPLSPMRSPVLLLLITALFTAALSACARPVAPTPLPPREFPTLIPPSTREPLPPSEAEATPTTSPLTPTAAPTQATPTDTVPVVPQRAATEPVDAEISDMELQIADSIPVQVTVVLRGSLPESCARIVDVQQRVRGDVIDLSVQAVRPVDVLCAQALTPFQVTTMLALQDLEPGRYTLRAGQSEETLNITEGMLQPPRSVGTRQPEVSAGLAPVESVQVNIMESLPVQVSLTVQGAMPDTCTEVSHYSQRVSGSTIYVSVYAARPQDRLCAQALTPYQMTIPVGLQEITPGDYVIDVNGITTTLSLEPGMLGTPRPGGSGARPANEVISGRAAVDSVEVAATSEVSATLIVRGNLPDGCTQIADHVQTVQGDVLRVELYTTRPADRMCTQALVPFEERLTVDLTGLESGAYAVDVNGLRTELTVE